MTNVRGRIKATGSMSANISCESHHDPFVEKMERLEYGYGGCHDTTQARV
jgi:hypothetical protein